VVILQTVEGEIFTCHAPLAIIETLLETIILLMNLNDVEWQTIRRGVAAAPNPWQY
jgi:hypothetical protein